MQAGGLQRLRLHLSGAVQGVGFRPFVYRLAHELDLSGWVGNDPAGVTLEVEGEPDRIERFVGMLQSEAPPRARIHDIATTRLEPTGCPGFRIAPSDGTGERSTALLPDTAPCAECMADVRSGEPRRRGYPFTNCTNCGPRFSIITALPYDRPDTTMRGFTMCVDCTAEYEDPFDRRFHAQPNACAVCGPSLTLWDGYGTVISTTAALADAAAAIRRGAIVAVKGIGGFHLMVDALNTGSIGALRRRKRRPAKPLAVMVADLAAARAFAHVSMAEAQLLESAEAPIVLLQRRRAGAVRLPYEIAPGNPRVGLMLPSTPLHHLLLEQVGGPVVATSGNLSEEPICIDDRDALVRLAGIADFFLVHDRPIERHVDDSVADVVDGAPRLLRRARGYAPLPVSVPLPLPAILAAGPHMKNTVALARGTQVCISQHIGDLDDREARLAFERVAADFLRLYDVRPAAIAHDMHPDYPSTAWAQETARVLGVPAVPVQHHHAHLVACMLENGVQEKTLGVIWDGTGYGPDGTVWGGEFLVGDAAGCERVAHLRPFRLPGGDAAVREPRRVAAALLHEAAGPASLDSTDYAVLGSFSMTERRALRHMIESGLNSPLTSSAGRLFDGIAALLGLCSVSTFEGEAAIRLEHAVDAGEHGAYPLPLLTATDGPGVLDWRPMISDVLADARRGTDAGVIAARVHNAMVEAMVLQAEFAGCDRVALSGGCFQNRLLSERAAAALRRRGFTPLLHRQVPPNDGGIALGQVAIAAAVVIGSAHVGARAGAAPTPVAR
jgi:hydrogenase maturation protein HypF